MEQLKWLLTEKKKKKKEIMKKKSKGNYGAAEMK